jgi:putative transcriptional regulator
MDMTQIRDGSILISEPFLGDPNFERTVVLVCKHDEEGTFGLVLNRKSTLKLSDVLDYDHSFDAELGVGGPMQYNTLHYIHRIAEVEESVPLAENLFWGGDYEQLQELIMAGRISPEDIRFFLGYSGWSPGQLEEEIDKNVWIVNNNATDKLFTLDVESLWRLILKEMGGKYKVLANYPIDPSLN